MEILKENRFKSWKQHSGYTFLRKINLYDFKDGKKGFLYFTLLRLFFLNH